MDSTEFKSRKNKKSLISTPHPVFKSSNLIQKPLQGSKREEEGGE